MSFLDLLGARLQPLSAGRAGIFPGASRAEPRVEDRYSFRTQAFPDLEARLCAAPGCTGSRRLWKSRRRPVFEGGWGCGTRCLHTLVRAAVRREVSGPRFEEAIPVHRHRVPLGLVLLDQGWISHEQLQRALEAQREAGHGRIGEWLKETCGLNEQLVTRALALQWGSPVLNLEGFSASAMALVLPRPLVETLGLLPLRIAGGRILYLAAEDRRNAAAELSLERMSGLQVESGLLPAMQYKSVRDAVLASDTVKLTQKQVSDGDDLVGQIAAVLDEAQPVEAQLGRFGNYYWLRMWLERGALGSGASVPQSEEDVEDLLLKFAD